MRQEQIVKLAARLARTLNDHRDGTAPVASRYPNPLECPLCVQRLDDLTDALQRRS